MISAVDGRWHVVCVNGEVVAERDLSEDVLIEVALVRHAVHAEADRRAGSSAPLIGSA